MAIELREMGSAAAEALPALRQAPATEGYPHRSYLADTIKAIETNAPKPVFDRDSLMPALRRLSDAVAALAPALSDYQQLTVAESVRHAGEHTPRQFGRARP